jgi:lipopolysaccharide heptosyltransferase II
MNETRSRARKGLKRAIGRSFLLVDRIVEKLRPSCSLFNSRDIRNILIVEMQGIGDALAMLPAVKALIQRFPEAKITLISQKVAVELFERLGYFDHIIPLGRNKSELGLADFIRSVPRLRREVYDLFVVPSWSIRHTAVSLLVRSKTKIGYLHDHSFKMVYHNDYTVEVRGLASTKKVKYYKEEHIITRALKAVEPLGVVANKESYEVEAGPKERKEIRELLQTFGAKNQDDQFIIIAPGAVWERRTWPPDKWKQLVEILTKKFRMDFFVVGSRADRHVASHICDGIRVFDLCGRLDLPQLMALMEKSRGFIGVDSGPMHLAAALGKPVVALFGPNVPEVCGPKGTQSVVVEKKMACRPCEQVFCPVPKGQRCMELIAPEDVARACDALLGRVAGKKR